MTKYTATLYTDNPSGDVEQIISEVCKGTGHDFRIKPTSEMPQDCPKCGHVSCVCDIIAAHSKNCLFRRAATCRVPIACDPHGRDCCPVCDPCTCTSKKGKVDAHAH